MQQSVLRKTIYLAAVERSNLNAPAGIEYATDQELAEAEPLQFKSSSFVVPFGIDLPELLSEARQELRARLEIPG